jgi:hypothetical protein
MTCLSLTCLLSNHVATLWHKPPFSLPWEKVRWTKLMPFEGHHESGFVNIYIFDLWQGDNALTMHYMYSIYIHRLSRNRTLAHSRRLRAPKFSEQTCGSAKLSTIGPVRESSERESWVRNIYIYDIIWTITSCEEHWIRSDMYEDILDGTDFSLIRK